jgi:glutaredoxin
VEGVEGRGDGQAPTAPDEQAPTAPDEQAPTVPERIRLLSRPGCHLCDDARAVIERVAGELGVGWAERDITASAEDMREYWDKIPVTFVDGVQVDFWRVSEERLRAALGRERP